MECLVIANQTIKTTRISINAASIMIPIGMRFLDFVAGPEKFDGNGVVAAGGAGSAGGVGESSAGAGAGS